MGRFADYENRRSGFRQKAAFIKFLNWRRSAETPLRKIPMPAARHQSAAKDLNMNLTDYEPNEHCAG